MYVRVCVCVCIHTQKHTEWILLVANYDITEWFLNSKSIAGSPKLLFTSIVRKLGNNRDYLMDVIYFLLSYNNINLTITMIFQAKSQVRWSIKIRSSSKPFTGSTAPGQCQAWHTYKHWQGTQSQLHAFAITASGWRQDTSESDAGDTESYTGIISAHTSW